jgi:hypothetical protein
MSNGKLTTKVDILVYEIVNGDYSLNDLRTIHNALRLAHRNKSVIASRNFEVGEKVKFTMKSGLAISGTVMKVNIKNILVKVSPTKQYRVPAAMLQPA